MKRNQLRQVVAVQERDRGWLEVKRWYSQAEIQNLYAAFATSAILEKMREAYAGFIASEVHAGEDLVILELGVGPGHQFEYLVSQATLWPVRSLRVIGVDLCPTYLTEAADRLERAARELPFPVTFHGVAASFTDLGALDLGWKPALAVSTLALHHLTWKQKVRFFREVPRWGVRGFFIGEVDSLVDWRPGEPDAGRETGRELYQSVFRAVNEQAGLDPAVAAKVNRYFFEPEQRRIVENSYARRGEYYVSQADWLRFLIDSGFGVTNACETFVATDGGYRLVAVTGRRETRGDEGLL